MKKPDLEFVTGDLVECVDCGGDHTGKIVHVMGRFYSVAWDDRNLNFGKPGNTAPQYPQHFLREHKNHLVSVEELAIRHRR